MYFVSWKYYDYLADGSNKAQFCLITGQALADMYGFSDCTGACDFKVWEIDNDSGELIRRNVYGSVKAPFNWLIIEDMDGNEIERYEWPEH